VALYEDTKELKCESLRHKPEDLASFDSTLAQLEYRRDVIGKLLSDWKVDTSSLAAVVGRGGPFKPLVSGTYMVNEVMIADIREGRVAADHPSNLGALLAHGIASPLGIPAFIVDPVSVDEFIPQSRLSGMPEIERRSLSHALNMKMVGRKAASEIGKPYEELNFVICHLGTGISIGAHRKGRQIDVNNANDGGPFSAQRTGYLPVTQLVKLCYSGKYDAKTMRAKITKKGGLLAYTGSDHVQDLYAKAETDEDTALVLQAMVQQIAKEIGAQAAVLDGNVDAIVITGGMAYEPKLTEHISRKVKFITENILVFPGEDELEALTRGALRVLSGEVQPMEYE
ncbi:butyrate kinase, partial [candidate division WOR-3 bacterium]|nr:butyrate kinase [candidate division WOR-3 bacterium]MBD3363683.1 butyrate kinase [candidate division WOR-3 bacterium]